MDLTDAQWAVLAALLPPPRGYAGTAGAGLGATRATC